MAFVYQLVDDSWLMVCAACCCMALIFAIRHIIFLKFVIVSVHSIFLSFFFFSFFLYSFFNLVLINQTKVHDTSMS